MAVKAVFPLESNNRTLSFVIIDRPSFEIDQSKMMTFHGSEIVMCPLNSLKEGYVAALFFYSLFLCPGAA